MSYSCHFLRKRKKIALELAVKNLRKELQARHECSLRDDRDVCGIEELVGVGVGVGAGLTSLPLSC